ncbi:DUF4388 domain-containing protein [Deferrisoma camini]|uniref:DUF4388 domain-containing protein n=1 Tax=Deferrisoma camini TaxID=1035120 RepID=UPI00046D4560|nr:DUF4388 domain-containing protein [Deferrisoma camini]
MSLQGTLDSFNLSELLQLIAHQGKTGTLEIEVDRSVARLRFRDGRLVEAWPDRRSPAELIGARLVRAGLITPAQLGMALERQRQSLRRLGDILVSMGVLRLGEFREVLTLQHRETVYRLLGLNRGSFRFRDEPVELEEGVSVPLDVGELLMEGFRQIDEWPRLQEKIPSDRMVLVRRAGGGLPEDLDPVAVKVLSLVDGVASVREIVDRARVGEFRGMEALAELMDRGLVQPAGVSRSVRAKKPRLRRRPPWDLAGGLVLAAAGLWLLWSAGPHRLSEVGRGWERRQEVRSVWAERVARWNREPSEPPPKGR